MPRRDRVDDEAVAEIRRLAVTEADFGVATSPDIEPTEKGSKQPRSG